MSDGTAPRDDDAAAGVRHILRRARPDRQRPVARRPGMPHRTAAMPTPDPGTPPATPPGAGPSGSVLPLGALIFDVAADGIIVMDAAGRIEAANPSAMALFGGPPGAFVGRPVASLAAPGELERVPLGMAELREGRAIVRERTYVRHDGSHIRLQTATSMAADGRCVIICRDLTEADRQRRRLAMMTRLYAVLTEVNQAVVRIGDEERLLQAVCDIAVGAGGFAMAWVGRVDAVTGRIVPTARAGRHEGYLAALFEAQAGHPEGSGPAGRAVRTGEVQVTVDIATDPSMSPWREAALARGFRSSAGVPFRRAGTVVGLINLYAEEPGFFTREEQHLLRSIGADVSHALDALAAEAERAAALEALARSEDRLREALAASATGVFEHDHRTDAVFLSPEHRRIWGFDAEATVTLADLVAATHPDDAEPVAAAARRAHDPAGDGRFEVEHRIRRPDGATRWITVRSRTVFEDGRPRRTTGAVRDVTEVRAAAVEREQLAERLRDAQKMELVGRLAGGVAHDFNNMLSVIVGNAEEARDVLPADSPARESLDGIIEAARRSAQLTRQLLAFARRQPSAPRQLALNETIGQSLDLLRRLLTAQVELRWEPAPELWVVRCDPTQFDQVLTNLTVNARDAIGGAGVITIATGNVALDAGAAARVGAPAPGDYVRVLVRDTGAGIAPEVLPHLFEPFFTTKGVGRGTGLGLATVFGIVQQHGGFVTVDSTPGAGATFAVFLPRADAMPAPDAAGPSPAPPSPTKAARILFVEDDADVRRVGVQMLSRLGHAVHACAHPDEALRTAAALARPDLLVLDVMMPGMNGVELAGRLRALWPSVPVLFVSAYPADLVTHQSVLEDGAHVLQKPFTARELAERLSAILGA